MDIGSRDAQSHRQYPLKKFKNCDESQKQKSHFDGAQGRFLRQEQKFCVYEADKV